MEEFAHAKGESTGDPMRQAILEKGPDLRRRVLLATIAGVPVLFLRSVNDPINVPKLALIFIGVSLAAAIKGIELLQGASLQSLKRAWLPAAAIVGPLLIGWLASPYKGWALFGLYDRFQGLLPYAAVALAAILVADSFDGRIDQIAWALAFSAAIVGLYGLIQVLGLDPLEWSRAAEAASDAGSTIGNPNFTGGFLAMTLPMFVGLWIARPDRRLPTGVMAALALAGWIVAFSQGAWAAGVAAIALTLGVLFADRLSWVRAASIVVVVLIASAVVGQVLFGMVKGGGPFVPGTVLLRADAWKGAIGMAGESPIVGRGPNSYAVEGPQYRTEADALRLGYDYPNDPHSVFFAMATAAGVLGALGFVALIVWVGLRARRISDGDLWGAVVIGAIAAYFIQSLVSIDELSLRFTFWALLGALGVVTTQEVLSGPETATRGRSRPKRKVRREPLRNLPGVAAIGVLAIAALWFTGRFFVADAYALSGVLQAGQGRAAEARSDFERAIELRPEYEYRRLYGLRVGAAAVRSPDGAAVIQPAREALTFLDGFPYVSMLVERARILQASAVFDENALEASLRTWERARALDPLNPLIAVETASVLLQLERPEDALDVLDPYADDVGDRFPQYWGALALVRAESGDRAGAHEALDRGLALDPQNDWVREAELFLEAMDRQP